MLSVLSDIDLISVFFALVGSMLVGIIWYSPMAFGEYWMKLMHRTPDAVDRRKATKMLIMSILTNFLTALSLAAIFAFIDVRTVPEGIFVSVILWFGFIAMIQMTHALFEGKSLKLVTFGVAHELVSMMVMGIILGAWR